LTITLPDPLIDKRAVPVPILSAIGIDKSRPITTVTQAILIPIAPTIETYDGRPVIPVKFSIIICKLVHSVLKDTTGIKEVGDCFPEV
jgi:hypothetical protein